MIRPFVPIKWLRYVLPKTTRPWSKGRLAAAARAVKREQDSVALFPELSNYKTVEDRVSDMDQTERSFLIKSRARQAALWIDVRSRLRAMRPSLRHGVLVYWREASYPVDPLYLLQIVIESARRCPWRRLRQLRLYKKIGQTKDQAARVRMVGIVRALDTL